MFVRGTTFGPLFNTPSPLAAVGAAGADTFRRRMYRKIATTAINMIITLIITPIVMPALVSVVVAVLAVEELI